ncbi:MAG: DUF4404 family protein [Myxococcales bacterium]|nr:DUF4404 family protein [Myxococcales bacterium]MDH3483606.1 DUF4404 family protein [Myxococcales bacterium]
MPRKRLQEALDTLHQQLESTEELGEQDREALLEAMEDIRKALSISEPPSTEGALGRRIYALIEDLEGSHPKFAEILRNVSESLANLGI